MQRWFYIYTFAIELNKLNQMKTLLIILITSLLALSCASPEDVNPNLQKITFFYQVEDHKDLDHSRIITYFNDVGYKDYKIYTKTWSLDTLVSKNIKVSIRAYPTKQEGGGYIAAPRYYSIFQDDIEKINYSCDGIEVCTIEVLSHIVGQ